MSDVMRELAKPFSEKFVHTNPSGGGSYIKHHVINQRLIQVLGQPPSFEKVEVIYGDVNGYKTSKGVDLPDLKNVIVAVVGRLTVEINGSKVVVEEAGDCEQPHNWKTDGQRLKDAMSDAYKRCAMRLGVGLHLWSQNEYFLYEKLSESSPEAHRPQTSKPQAGQEVSGEPLAESAQAEPQASLDVSPPDSADGGGSRGEVTSASSADELIAQYGEGKVLLAARKVAKAHKITQPLSATEINEPLAALVSRELANA